jgi:hypothetical protein
MDKETLDLTLCQLIKVSDASKKNHHAYSDFQKRSFHEEIEALLLEIQKTDFSTLNENDKLLHRKLFEILFIWLEFLDNSTLNFIPYEIVRCLKAVLEDWLEDEDFQKFVIVTSLQSQLLSFSFLDLELGSLTTYVEEKYGKKIGNTLVPINLPKYLVHDYLANVTLYHEVAHFIDRHFRISRRIIDSDVLFKEMEEEDKEVHLNHLSEYFADIFAAQYIGDKCSMYLNYIAHGDPDSYTHPSTQRRVDIVDSFLNNREDVYITKLKDATVKLTKKELKPGRYKEIQTNDFENFLPAEVEEKAQLHYLFIQGWESWYNSSGSIRATFSSSRDRHRVINNLIEKSISNFIVREKWNQYVSN